MEARSEAHVTHSNNSSQFEIIIISYDLDQLNLGNHLGPFGCHSGLWKDLFRILRDTPNIFEFLGEVVQDLKKIDAMNQLNF